MHSPQSLATGDLHVGVPKAPLGIAQRLSLVLGRACPGPRARIGTKYVAQGPHAACASTIRGAQACRKFDGKQYQTSTLAEYMESIWFFVATSFESSSSSDASSSNKKTWPQLAVCQESAHTLRHPRVTGGRRRVRAHATNLPLAQ
jgi:hypothetical protein